ncbi:MAG: hypothetical protein KF712_14675 [Akkermansiaceae bacterium]|nr:hypothetical protein [Akkermansiaceae bacterium]
MRAGTRKFRKAGWLVGIIFVTSAILADAAISAAWEQFPTRKNADEWLVYDWGRSQYYLPSWDSTADGEHIWFYHDGDAVLEFSADRVSADGWQEFVRFGMADLQRMTTTAPFIWWDVSGHTFITGPGQHVFTTPLSGSVGIFRVAVFPDYFPVIVE